MAVQTSRIDDLTGEPDAVQTTIVVNGRGVDIDLASKSGDRLAKALAPFFDKGQPGEYDVERRTRARNGAARGYDLDALRRWAADQGIALPSRGRIPAAIVSQYLHR